MKVDEFKVITVMNEAMIKVLERKNESIDKNLKIREYLNDEAFFFKINQENAYKILEAVGVRKEQIENSYNKLISSDVFYDLLNRGIIDAKDEALVIKYKIYGSDVF